MLGGLPRRATYIRSLTSQTTLLKVENGDLTKAGGRQDEMKAETMIDMLNDLQYDAINLGEKDFALGLSYLQSLQKRFKGVFLCGNVCKPDGPSLFKEYTLIKRDLSRKPVRIVLTGLLSEQFRESVQSANPEVRLESPFKTLERLQAEINRQDDVRILLYHGPRSEAEQLARRFTFFQIIVCAHEGDYPMEKKRVGDTLLAGNGQDGKYIGQATITPGASGQASDVRYTALGPDIKEDARILQLKSAYLDRMAAEDLLGQVIKLPTSNGDTYTGSAACASCHQKAYETWQISGHAKAMQTLVSEKHDKDPECVACHVVGLEKESGFISRERTPHLQDVGCESCHGAAARHVQDPRASLGKAGSASCMQCHVPQHSPNFDFEKYWEKIKH